MTNPAVISRLTIALDSTGMTNGTVGEPLLVALALGTLTVAILSVPFALAAIDYRQRDNGLAYILLVAGVGVWNGMVFAQLLTPEPLVQVFFLALAVVGAVLAGLGFFLFATTASSTPEYLSRRSVYAVVSVLGGLDIVFAVTAPVHQFYWSAVHVEFDAYGFAIIEPGIGYLLHTALLVLLFGAGAVLFMDAWLNEPEDLYRLSYVVAGFATLVAIVGSNLLAPGGLGVASIAAGSLTSVGWLHASRGQPMAWVRGITG